MRGELDALIGQMHKGEILYGEAVREFRKAAFIATVLRDNNGNQSKAARELGMHQNEISRTVSALRLQLRWPESFRWPRHHQESVLSKLAEDPVQRH
jgi:transcriptional regulator with GAF, ATPase, and Fis domain